MNQFGKVIPAAVAMTLLVSVNSKPRSASERWNDFWSDSTAEKQMPSMSQIRLAVTPNAPKSTPILCVQKIPAQGCAW
jgi:hypothetical protein